MPDTETLQEFVREHIRLNNQIKDLEESKRALATCILEEMKVCAIDKAQFDGVGSVAIVRKQNQTLDKSRLKIELTKYMAVDTIESALSTCTKTSESVYPVVTPVKGD